MSITDELREWFKDRLFMGNGYAELTAIADRIDAEHERMLGDWDYWESTHVELPKDADGEYIRIGDELEFSAFETEKPVTRMVDGIGQGVFFAWCGERGYQQHEAKRYRHYHAPTVEDVLREMLDAWGELPSNATNEAIIAEYAAKLRLAEGEDA